jgi:hypothetical protein
MAVTLATFRTLSAERRIRAEVMAVSVLVVLVALVLGAAARRSAKTLDAELARLRMASEEVESFRSAFATQAAQGDSIRLPESVAIAIPRDVRFSLAQRIASLAEDGGLNNVRVRFGGPDSSTAPSPPQLAGNPPTVADYTLSVEAGGRFASVLSLVNHLPPSVALQRLRVSRSSDGTPKYSLILAVFEAPGQNQHG